MELKKNSAIYRNDNLEIKDESIKGIVKDVKEYFLYEIASQCMTIEAEYENIISNFRMVADLLENLEEIENDKEVIIVKYNPMGAFYYIKEEEV